MKRSKETAEVIVRLDYLEKTAHICVAEWPAMAVKMQRAYGPGLDSAGGRTRRWVVPLRAISFRRPVTKARKAAEGGTLPFSRRSTDNSSNATASAGATVAVHPVA